MIAFNIPDPPTGRFSYSFCSLSQATLFALDCSVDPFCLTVDLLSNASVVISYDEPDYWTFLLEAASVYDRVPKAKAEALCLRVGMVMRQRMAMGE